MSDYRWIWQGCEHRDCKTETAVKWIKDKCGSHRWMFSTPFATYVANVPTAN